MSDQDTKATGTKFSQFPVVEGDGIEGVGLKDGGNVRFALTTDAIAVNPDTFRDAKGRYAAPPEELENIKNQRDVNVFLSSKIDSIEFPPGTVVGEEPEAPIEEGVLWFDTSTEQLYVRVGGEWLKTTNLDELSQAIGQGQAEQEDIKERLEELEDDLGAIGKHRYELTASAVVNNGQFNMLDAEGNFTNVTADAAFITLSSLDYDERPVPVDNIDHGDHIRIQEMGAADVADRFVDFQALDDGVDGLIAVKKDAGNLAEAVPLERYAISDKSDFATKAYSDRGDEALREEIAVGEVKQRDLQDKLDEGIAEQEKLKDKIAAIEGSTAASRYAYALEINPRNGKFVALLSDYSTTVENTSELGYLAFGGENIDGNTPDWDKIKIGDVLRIANGAGLRVEYKVEECNNGLFVVNQAEEPVSLGFDTFILDEEYTTTVLSTFDPTGLATIDYVDQRVDTKLEKTGDKMSGVLNMSENYIANVKDPSSDGDAANRRYVKKKMEGVLTQNSEGHTVVDQAWRLRAPSSDGTWTYLRIEGNVIGVYHMADPTESHHAANRRYVDNSIADGNFAGKDVTNTFKDVQTFVKSTYFQGAVVLNGKNTDTLIEIRGENEETRELWHKIRGTNKMSWICYPGQENKDYKRCMSMEWDQDLNKPKVFLDYLTDPTNDRHAATKKYVDDKVSEAGGGSFAETGATTPSLTAGQLFYNTTDKVLYIGE